MPFAVMITQVVARLSLPFATLRHIPSKNSPFGVKAAKRTPAKSYWDFTGIKQIMTNLVVGH
ncbi:hypothetical protein CR513_11783, partial [Mucuna pruriens]